jgi:hypothetical protein
MYVMEIGGNKSVHWKATPSDAVPGAYVRGRDPKDVAQIGNGTGYFDITLRFDPTTEGESASAVARRVLTQALNDMEETTPYVLFKVKVKAIARAKPADDELTPTPPWEIRIAW